MAGSITSWARGRIWRSGIRAAVARRRDSMAEDGQVSRCVLQQKETQRRRIARLGEAAIEEEDGRIEGGRVHGSKSHVTGQLVGEDEGVDDDVEREKRVGSDDASNKPASQVPAFQWKKVCAVMEAPPAWLARKVPARIQLSAGSSGYSSQSASVHNEDGPTGHGAPELCIEPQ